MKLAQSLLWPLTLPYGSWVRFRAWSYRKGIFQQKRLNGTVISVGNLTTGGTGKTPMVCWIANRLLAEGKNAGVLTRGYRGRSASAAEESGKSSRITSDEVELLKARLGNRIPIGVGARRFRTGQELARQGVQWFVLDDGFQHLPLARDVDIVLVDATNPFGDGKLLPAGRLREPKSALARAHVIVITRSIHSPALEAAIRRDSAAPIFYAHTTLDSIHAFSDGLPSMPQMDDLKVRGQKFFAFCGVGNPSAFVVDLRDWGIQLAGSKFFRDHHRYTQENVREIEAEARTAGADALLCTEKDVFNLTGVRAQSLDVMFCRISLRIESEEDFWRAVMAAVESPARPRSKRATR
jgi:tetraacyldisaccharide 4'-kinase